MTRRFSPARPIAVTATAPDWVPRAICWRGQWAVVAEIVASWEVAEGWWRGEAGATRQYFRLVVAGGPLCVVYRDRRGGEWYLEVILD